LILAEWSIEVPENKLEELFRFAKEKLKPFYLSHGCKNHALLVPVEKKYFPYQTMLKKTRIVEQMTFYNLAEFEEFLKRVEKNPNGKEITESYEKKFHATSANFRILMRKV